MLEPLCTFQSAYHCQCCHGYEGKYCGEINACASSPCQNAGICADIKKEEDVTGKRFTCTCPRGETHLLLQHMFYSICGDMIIRGGGTGH